MRKFGLCINPIRELVTQTVSERTHYPVAVGSLLLWPPGTSEEAWYTKRFQAMRAFCECRNDRIHFYIIVWMRRCPVPYHRNEVQLPELLTRKIFFLSSALSS